MLASTVACPYACCQSKPGRLIEKGPSWSSILLNGPPFSALRHGPAPIPQQQLDLKDSTPCWSQSVISCRDRSSFELAIVSLAGDDWDMR